MLLASFVEWFALLEQVARECLVSFPSSLPLTPHLGLDECESVQVKDGCQGGTHLAIKRVPGHRAIQFQAWKRKPVEEGNSRASMIVSCGIKNAVHLQMVGCS